MLKRWFVRARIDEMPPGARVIAYALLALWSLVVLFPLYWMAITSFKLPIDVSSGPCLSALHRLQAEPRCVALHLRRSRPDTFRPYLNSLIIATCGTAASVFFGSMAAYALARIEYRPPVAAVGLGVLMIAALIAAVGWGGVDLRIAAAVGLALFVLLLRPIVRRARRHLGNDDILFWIVSQRILPPVVTVIPIYLTFKSVGLLDTHLALIITYNGERADRRVADVRFLRRRAEGDRGERADRRRDAFRDPVRHRVSARGAGPCRDVLLVLILSWNEYLFALFLTTANAQTLPLLVAAQNATRGPQWWNMSVLILIMILPVMVLTLTLQRFIVKGILVGAVKG